MILCDAIRWEKLGERDRPCWRAGGHWTRIHWHSHYTAEEICHGKDRKRQVHGFLWTISTLINIVICWYHDTSQILWQRKFTPPNSLPWRVMIRKPMGSKMWEGCQTHLTAACCKHQNLCKAKTAIGEALLSPTTLDALRYTNATLIQTVAKLHEENDMLWKTMKPSELESAVVIHSWTLTIQLIPQWGHWHCTSCVVCLDESWSKQHAL